MTRFARHACWIGLAAVALGCDGSTKPEPAPDLAVVFVDGEGRLNTVRAGHAPELTGLRNVQPLAPTTGAMAYYAAEELRLFHLDGRVEPLPVPATNRGVPAAISGDGSTLAFVYPGALNKLFLYTVDLATGARDSLNLADRPDAVAAVQALGKTPVFSPSGDSVAFLLPNIIGMQLLIYEVRTKRLEVFPIPVPITTFIGMLDAGWPRWTPDQSIRFLGRHHVNGEETDTLMVMRVFPRSRERWADVAYLAVLPDSLSLDRATDYSFSADGETVVFSVTADARPGIFYARRGDAEARPLVYERGLRPIRPLLIP
jgi:hypothetical protein